MNESNKKMNLLEKMNVIMTNITNISKDKENTFHKYKYASEEAIKRAVHKELAMQGIVFKMDIVDITTQQTQTDKGTSNLVYAKCAYQFYDVSSNEVIDGEFYGCGEDKGDKALYKATTGAIKYILTTTFLIPTGDDPENDNGSLAFEGNKLEVNDGEKPVGSNVVKCKDCGSVMKYEKKIKKADGTKYGAYFCPLQDFNDKVHHKMFGYEVLPN